MSTITEQVAEMIRESRIKSGLTQQEIADKLGVSQSAFNRYEKGRQNLTIDTIQKIATAIGVEINIVIKP